MHQRTVPLAPPVDVAATVTDLRRGAADPSLRLGGDGIWRATRLPSGAATVHLVPHADRVEARAWGDGAEEALEWLPDLVGLADDVTDFAPEHPLIRRIWHDHPGLRLTRSNGVTEAIIASVLEQRVTTFEARRALRQLVERFGEDAPGPGGLRLLPDPELLAGVPYYDLHVIGVERHRADTLRRVAVNARALDGLRHETWAEARRRLLEVPGIGPWTAAEVARRALADPDAVPLGDVHLPADVTYALTGETVDDDDAMLAALEPFTGHRARVLRLLAVAGVRAPRRAPRYAPRDIRRD